MKILLSLSLLCVFAANVIAMDDKFRLDEQAKLLMECLTVGKETVSFSEAHKGQDLSGYKQVYLAVYTKLAKSLLTNDQLQQRFDSMDSLIGNDENFNFVLFEQDKKPVGFLPFFKQTIKDVRSAIIYDTPVLPEVKKEVLELVPYMADMFKIKEGYCFVGKGAEEIKKMVLELDFKKDNDAPITMNDKIMWNPKEYGKYCKNLIDNSNDSDEDCYHKFACGIHPLLRDNNENSK